MCISIACNPIYRANIAMTMLWQLFYPQALSQPPVAKKK